MALTKDLSAVYMTFMSIYNHEFLIFNHANSAIANINNCLSLGLNKTGYEMNFNCAGHSTQSTKYEKFEMKSLGCEILGTAAKTLAPVTNFSCAAASLKSKADVLCG